MTIVDRLAGQHIREYESRLKHIDELIELAHKATTELKPDHPLKSEVDQYREQRAELARQVEQPNEISKEHWREDLIASSGPMAVWDILAQKLEELVEKLDK